MHIQKVTAAAKIIPTDQWTAWRRNVADTGGTLAVVTGTFTLLHPGNLAAIREAARQASHTAVIINPASPERCGRTSPASPKRFRRRPAAPDYGGQDGRTSPVSQDAAIPNTDARVEMAAHLRAVSMAGVCPPDNPAKAFARLRPFTLFDCVQPGTPDPITAAARKMADRIVNLAPIPGCFSADIQKAIREGRTPICVPETAMASLPSRSDLERFLTVAGRWPANGHETGKGALVTVNGCFDVLHVGHVRFLARAAARGARLLALVNDDDSVRNYKGAARPIFPIRFRLHALNALEAVTMAYPFAGDNPLTLLAAIRPDIHIKGGSYEETRVSEEKQLLESWGGRLEIMPLVEGFSTTGVVSRMAGR